MMFFNVQFMFRIYLVLFHMYFIGNAFASANCRQTEYRVGEDCCPACPAGMYVKQHCTEFTGTSCRPCPEGTYQDNINGGRPCKSCTNCNAGLGLKVKKFCTSTSDALCENLDGYFCIHHNRVGCFEAQKHTVCSPGQYISQRGTADKDTECLQCANGTFSDGTSSSCQPHTNTFMVALALGPGNMYWYGFLLACTENVLGISDGFHDSFARISSRRSVRHKELFVRSFVQSCFRRSVVQTQLLPPALVLIRERRMPADSAPPSFTTFKRITNAVKCESVGLKQIQPGSDSTDSECGGHDVNTGLVPGIIPGLILVMLAIISTIILTVLRQKISGDGKGGGGQLLEVCSGDERCDAVEETCDSGLEQSDSKDERCDAVEETCDSGLEQSDSKDERCDAVEETCDSGLEQSDSKDERCDAVEETCDSGLEQSDSKDERCDAVEETCDSGLEQSDSKDERCDAVEETCDSGLEQSDSKDERCDAVEETCDSGLEQSDSKDERCDAVEETCDSGLEQSDSKDERCDAVEETCDSGLEQSDSKDERCDAVESMCDSGLEQSDSKDERCDAVESMCDSGLEQSDSKDERCDAVESMCDSGLEQSDSKD
ncbi:Tumor necrosis factor receptor superfamily member 14 [Merluccius polli]|uniref:Tumor necrosis factor receptor superfamily member 14 n=1 Tax=Merluccius polli TaxID=89951 RepID=A0AA47N960_MERPO|nr:Tumor necrosis factor receptor superfamily member 14 [Merluccius polli]